jgi:hypothetical protein
MRFDLDLILRRRAEMICKRGEISEEVCRSLSNFLRFKTVIGFEATRAAERRIWVVASLVTDELAVTHPEPQSLPPRS